MYHREDHLHLRVSTVKRGASCGVTCGDHGVDDIRTLPLVQRHTKSSSEPVRTPQTPTCAMARLRCNRKAPDCQQGRPDERSTFCDL